VVQLEVQAQLELQVPLVPLVLELLVPLEVQAQLELQAPLEVQVQLALVQLAPQGPLVLQVPPVFLPLLVHIFTHRQHHQQYGLSITI
jgi:hypothetical protein